MKKIFLIFVVLFSFLGCEKERENNSLIIAQNGGPKTLDPQMYNEIPALFITKQIFNTLLTTNEKGEIIPELAESFEYVNDKEIIFKLRKGVKFHNNEELTVKDVIFSFKRMTTKPGSKIMVEDIKKIEEIDKYTFKILLKKPSAPLLYSLTYPLTAILNEKDTMEKNDEVAITPIGTGPFIFSDWGNGEKIVLLSNKDYFLGKSKLDKLTFRSIPEGSSRLAALESGEVDIATSVSSIDKGIIENNPLLNLVSESTTSTEILYLNLKDKNFESKEVRQAINYAIDKQSIIDSLYLGVGKVADTIINPKVFGSYQEGKKYEYNPEKAKELLKSVGKEKGLSLTIWTNDNVTRTQIAQIIQANLKEVGIDLKIEVLEWGSYLQRSALGEHSILLGGWVAGTSDADIVLYPLVHSASAGGGGNKSFYSNKIVDEYIEEGRKTSKIEDRKKAYKEVQTIIAEDLPIIPLFYKSDIIGVSKKVKNFKFAPSTIHNFYKVEKEL